MLSSTHEAVWNTIEKRYWNNGKMMFFCAETGLGKTTGFRQAIKRLWDTYWPDLPVLIMVPTRKDADTMWQAMEAIEEGCAGVWTQVHDPSDTTTSDGLIPSVQFTKHDAVKKKCLILTHNAGKAAEDWIGRRDMVFVDEYPNPVSQELFEPYHFIQARDAEAKAGPFGELFTEAAQWAETQRDKGLKPVEAPVWAVKLGKVYPVTEAGRRLKLLAEAIQEGRAFQTKTEACSWTSYKYDLPFQDRSIVFSATAMYEGWRFGDVEELKKDGPKVDYSNVTCHWKPWPVGVSRYHKQILSNREQRETFFDDLLSWIIWPDQTTLIVCPKPFESDIRHMFPEAMVTHYGCDVGSNQYRDCNRVFLVSEFHKPSEVYRSHYLGHSQVAKVTDECLKPISNTRGKVYQEVVSDSYAVHLKQMLARGTCRFVDEEGKAQKMEAYCMIDKERFGTLLPELFPGVELVYPKGHQPKSGFNKNERVPTTSKLIQYLPTVDKEKDFVSAKDLEAAGIKIKGKPKKEAIARKEQTFEDIGWSFEQGTVGRYGHPSGFRRL